MPSMARFAAAAMLTIVYPFSCASHRASPFCGQRETRRPQRSCVRAGDLEPLDFRKRPARPGWRAIRSAAGLVSRSARIAGCSVHQRYGRLALLRPAAAAIEIAGAGHAVSARSVAYKLAGPLWPELQDQPGGGV